MEKQCKKFLAAAALVEKGKTYTINEAIELDKKASITLHFFKAKL